MSVSADLRLMLLAEGLLQAEELEELELKASTKHEDLIEFLVNMKRLTESDAARLFADYYGYDFLEHLPAALLNVEHVRTFSIHYLKRVVAVPLMSEAGEVLVALGRQASLDAVNEMRIVLQQSEMRPVFAPADIIIKAVNTIFGEMEGNQEALELLEGADSSPFSLIDDDRIEDLLDDTSDAPFIKLVNMILSQAVRSNASDIHIEPYKDVLRVRFRLDGVLYDKHSIAKRYHAALASRIKIMAKMDIAEKRLPQDGRIALSLGSRQVDLRVSCIPTTFGERLVMRLLEKSSRILSLPELGLTQRNLDRIHRLVKTSHGIILVTGPTGSGKTTSLYAILNHINSPDKNIMTIEDPVEYQLDGIGQIAVNTKTGLTFASGLRSILRQDPDVVLIGEIRDQETAEIAIQAALTGHLVFSTLHTNDAPSAVTRLIDMGVEPFLLSSVLRTVVAQRLVRRLCSSCKELYVPDAKKLVAEFGSYADTFREASVYRPVGCKACMDTGYQGRLALYEIMETSEKIKSMMLSTAASNQIREQALREGMEPLVLNGCQKVKAGQTTLAEILRVANE